ncbi:hypothetical protein J437_LFUL009705 [Ladona fulva]|uniref:Peptidoglycan-recognition protein n=1 Tax=Ladona fulva TaxID=123851 RepID=A0A8K0K2W3_LADFU|nr:hypothetical protein J437_LFUL009705 [Ladona fulva]
MDVQAVSRIPGVMMEVCKIALLFSAVLFADFANAACPSIVSRSDWGARAPTETTAMRTPVDYVIIHHTTTGSCSSRDSCSRILRNVQNDHMNNRKPKFSDIGYTYLIGGDGKVYEGRGWDTQGAHAPNYNHRSIGISFIGNFQRSRPPSSQLRAAQDLIECAVEKGKLKRDYKLLGHRQTKATDCPGQALYDIIKTWPKWTSNP